MFNKESRHCCDRYTQVFITIKVTIIKSLRRVLAFKNIIIWLIHHKGQTAHPIILCGHLSTLFDHRHDRLSFCPHAQKSYKFRFIFLVAITYMDIKIYHTLLCSYQKWAQVNMDQYYNNAKQIDSVVKIHWVLVPSSIVSFRIVAKIEKKLFKKITTATP